MSNEFRLPPDAQARHDMLGKMQASAKQKRDAIDPGQSVQVENDAQQESPPRRVEKPRK